MHMTTSFNCSESKSNNKATVKKNATTAKEQGWKEPTEFRGVPWGASVEMLKEKFRDAYCKEYEEDVTGDSICINEFSSI